MVSKSLKDYEQIVSGLIHPKYRTEERPNISWKNSYTSLMILLKQKIVANTFIRPSVLVALFYLLYVLGQLSIQKYDPKSFIFIGTR